MGPFGHSQATLRIYGDSLDPDAVSRLLGCEPTVAERKGEHIVGPKTGAVRVVRTGSWRLQATRTEPEDLPAQIDELLGKLTSDLGAWAKVRETYRIDLFVGLFMNSGNNGLSISYAHLRSLGERGIELGLDVYDHSD